MVRQHNIFIYHWDGIYPVLVGGEGIALYSTCIPLESSISIEPIPGCSTRFNMSPDTSRYKAVKIHVSLMLERGHNITTWGRIEI